jgi:diacylglycerol kinase family enzyme
MIVILNRAAGTAANTNGVAAEVHAQFEAAGLAADIRQPDEQHDVASIACDAAASRDKVIVAGGGDGTISAVAGVLAGTEKTLGVLPLGTLNHFAKDLGLPLDLPAAVQTIAQGHTTKVDVAEVNGRIFINNSSLGLYPHIVAEREKQQERLSRSKWTAFFWATLRAMKRFPFMNLRITLEEKQLVRQTAFLFIGNNEYQIAGFNLGARSCINRGNLGLYLTHRTGRLGLFRLGVRALFGRLEQAEDFDAFCVREAIIEARKARLLVATDGEVNWVETPLH